MGVQRAVDMALDASNKFLPPIFTYGPLIHNPQVLALLAEKGIHVMDAIPYSGSGTVIIRAHGVPPEARYHLEQAGFSVIDATCPRVTKVQSIIRGRAADGYACIIVGDADHPEVAGLRGYAGEMGHVVKDMEELERLPAFPRAIIVAQTTLNRHLFADVRAWAAAEHPAYKVFHTICDSTEQRQREARRLAETVDIVVVVGGHNSGNTQRLAEIVAHAGKPVQHVETEAELDTNLLRSAATVGLTAGASTPNWIIKRLYRAIEAQRGDRGGQWQRRLIAWQQYLLMTHLYIAFGAACLCLACSKLQGLTHYFPYILITMLYVLSMHILNTLTGMKEARYNDPERAGFYDAHKFGMTALALGAGGLGLTVAATMGELPFFLLAGLSILGLSYNMPLIPSFVLGPRFRRLRNIPGSKALLIAMAWGVVTTVFPCISVTGGLNSATFAAVVFSAGMVFSRNGFFNVLDMQGDRIAGKASLPLLLGKKRAMNLLRIVLAAAVAVLVIGVTAGTLPGLGIPLALCPLLLLLAIRNNCGATQLPGVQKEFLIDSLFVLAGLLTFGWWIVT